MEKGDDFWSDINPKIQERIEEITKPIFNKVLKEIDDNLLLVGKVTQKEPKFTYLQFHNYRRYYDFNKQNFRPPTYPLKIQKLGYKTVNYGSEHIFQNYKDCSVRVRKKTIQITNKINHKAWSSIDLYRAHDNIKDIVNLKEKESIFVLEQFLKEFGGTSNFKLISHGQEIKVFKNSITERLSPDLTWHTPKHKKVYKNKMIELYDIGDAINLIDNSIIYENIPELAEPLKVLAHGMNKLVPKYFKEFDWLKENIKTIAQGKQYKKDIENLNDDERWKLAKIIKKTVWG